MSRHPRGSGLMEVLVALPLIALLGVVAVELLLSVHRQVIREDGALGASRELRQGAAVLAAELRVLRPRDLVAWSDTAVEFDGTVGVGFACAVGAGGASLTLVGPDASMHDPDPLAIVWHQPPQAGDRVGVWLAGSTPADSLRAAVHTIRAVSSAADCVQSPLVTANGSEPVRIALLDSLVGRLAVGTPVRLSRRTRYSLYRAGDGDWFLGRRTRGPAGWDVVQPVAGPLQSARDHGLLIRVHDENGAVIDSASAGHATRVSIELRAPRRAGRAAPGTLTLDSTRIDVALRAERGDGR